MEILTPVNSWPELAALLPPCPDCGEPFGALGVPKAHEQAGCVALHNEVATSGDSLRIAAQRAILAMQFPCNSCISKSDEERERDAERNRIKRARAWSYTKGQMPEAAKEHTFKTSKATVELMNEKAWHMLHDWRGACSLWMCGAKGTGKTFGAHCVLNAAMDRGQRCAELSAFALANDAVRFDSTTRLKYCTEADVLLIEDLDKVTLTQKAAEALWWIVDQRCQRKLRTVITANWERRELAEKWKRELENHAMILSLWDRLLPCEKVAFEGQSQRMEEQQLLRETA